MATKFVPTEDQLFNIRKMAEDGQTRSVIASYLKVDRCVLPRLFRDYDIVLIDSSINKKGRKYEWDKEKEEQLKMLYASKEYNLIDVATYFDCSLKTVTNKAVEMKLSKVPSIEITPGEVEYFKRYHKEKSIEEMAKERRMQQYGVMYRLNKIGLTDKPPIYVNRTMPTTEEFWSDYINPNMSHTDVGRKYGIDRTTIGKWRRQDFGEEFKVMINTWLHKSEPEIIFEEILEDLGLAFHYQKKIAEWRCDYFLGFNLVVEINGTYWHSTEKAKIRDEKKYKDLKDAGYTVLVIWDKELHSIEKIKEKLLSTLKTSLSTYLGPF